FASFGRSQQLVRGHGWHVFGTLVLAWVILLAVNIVLSVIFLALPHALRSGLASIISGTLVAPFIALIVTLVYYRLAGNSPVTSPPAAGESYGGYQQSLGTSEVRERPAPRSPRGQAAGVSGSGSGLAGDGAAGLTAAVQAAAEK